MNAGQVFWHEGAVTMDAFLKTADSPGDGGTLSAKDAIREGSRNNTLSHFASRVLKRFGDTEKARDAFLERAGKCEPPLGQKELRTIWRSALKFFRNEVAASADYISPGEYENEFGRLSLMPEDYSDIGEAKVLAAHCADKLRYTSATDYLAFEGDRWHEDRQKALGAVESFMDEQLKDAEAAIRGAEEKLVAAGIAESDVKARGKDLVRQVPGESSAQIYALIRAHS